MSRDSDSDTLVLEPFLGVRFDPTRVHDLGAVMSPPYDVLGPHDAAALARLDPHNIVHVVLPGLDGGADRYAAAGRTWAGWLADGSLRRAEQPALYVLEQETGSQRVRGLVGCVGLRGPGSRAVVPHEDVMPGPVRDRHALLRATRANLEPILLVCDSFGEPTRAAMVDAVAGPPLVEAHGRSGTQRLWAITSPAVLEQVAADLAPRSAMIADGHHRYASYRAYQDECRFERRAHTAVERPGRDPGPRPWDSGLAVLVDQSACPLMLAAIHRVVPGLGLTAVAERARALFTVRAATAGEQPVAGSFLVTDGTDAVRLVPRPDQQNLVGASAGYGTVDTLTLHDTLLPLVGVDRETTVQYVHEAGAAWEAAVASRGVAFLLAPVALSTVVEMAAQGLRLPRKTTSFGPKPASGVIMRSLGG